MKKYEVKRQNHRLVRSILRNVLYWTAVACIALFLNGVLPDVNITINWVKCYFALAMVYSLDIFFDWKRYSKTEEVES